MATISGYAFYAKVQAPGAKYQKDGSTDPLDHQYSTDLIVSHRDAKKFYKEFPKNRPDDGGLLSAEKFKKRYKADISDFDMDTNEDGEVAYVKLKTNYAYKDHKTGETKLMPKPKVLFKGDNGKLVEDTKTPVGNGSEVMVQYDAYENKKWKTVSAKLKAIRVDDLVPYGGDDFSELGDVDESSFSDESPEMQKESDEFAEESSSGQPDMSDDDDSDFGFE